MEFVKRVWTTGRAWLAACLLLAGCAGLPGGADPVSVNVSDLRMGTAGVLEQQYFVTLRIQNPGERPLRLKGVAFELQLNGKAFAKGASGEAVEVPGFGTATVEVETFSTLTGILRQIDGMGTGEPHLHYRIRGRLHPAGVGSPIAFDEKGEVGMPGSAAAK